MPTATSTRKGKGRAQPEKVSAAMPLGKQLAHTDKAVRDRAVQGLVAFLSRGTYVDEESGESSTGYIPLSDSEMAKLWKGLFYCFWMSDKPLVQQALAADLAELLLQINPSTSDDDSDRLLAALGFLKGFWQAITREWSGLDRLRMDKFYLLMRRYVNATFRLLARHGWSKESIDGVNSILMDRTGPLTLEDKSVPSSLSTHLADIYLDELDKVLGQPDINAQVSKLCLPDIIIPTDHQPACPLVHLLHPHTTVLARTPTATVHSRILGALYTPLLNALALASDAERPAKRARTDEAVYPHILMGCCNGQEGVEARASPAELRRGVLDGLFKAAADVKANETCRRKIYKIWREEGGDDEDDE